MVSSVVPVMDLSIQNVNLFSVQLKDTERLMERPPKQGWEMLRQFMLCVIPISCSYPAGEGWQKDNGSQKINVIRLIQRKLI